MLTLLRGETAPPPIATLIGFTTPRAQAQLHEAGVDGQATGRGQDAAVGR